MASAIGIRVYEISVSKGGAKQPINRGSLQVAKFVSKFISKHRTSVQNSEMERSWYFELCEEDGEGNCRGYVHYGTFGFESNFVDAKTKTQNYRRKKTDVEEIPLFFEFWFPEDENFGYVAFQSFQGRSCINLVMADMKAAFERQSPEVKFLFRKLVPGDSSNTFKNAPVKQFRLIKRNAPGDLADRYFNNPEPDTVKFELVISARRTKSLGKFGGLMTSLKAKKNVIRYGGISFSEAVAEVQVGNKKRKVGVFGLNSDAGVIDVTDDIVRGDDGHPTFKSLVKETNAILEDMYETMRGNKS